MSNNTSKENFSLVKLFFTIMYISTFTFGGGFVMISLIKKRFVDQLHWIDDSEILDITAIAQSTPGAIAVNASILLGYKLAGIPGIIVSVLGMIIPPFFIIGIISYFYNQFINNAIVAIALKGLQIGVAVVIFDVVIDMSGKILKERHIFELLLLTIALFLTLFTDINIMLIVLSAMVIGIIRALINYIRNKTFTMQKKGAQK